MLVLIIIGVIKSSRWKNKRWVVPKIFKNSFSLLSPLFFSLCFLLLCFFPLLFFSPFFLSFLCGLIPNREIIWGPFLPPTSCNTTVDHLLFPWIVGVENVFTFSIFPSSRERKLVELSLHLWEHLLSIGHMDSIEGLQRYLFIIPVYHAHQLFFCNLMPMPTE